MDFQIICRLCWILTDSVASRVSERDDGLGLVRLHRSWGIRYGNKFSVGASCDGPRLRRAAVAESPWGRHQ